MTTDFTTLPLKWMYILKSYFTKEVKNRVMENGQGNAKRTNGEKKKIWCAMPM
jgi:hypothetical protein